MNTAPTPRPPGTVSTIRGRWQRPMLAWATRVLLVASLVTTVAPREIRAALAVAVVAAVVAVPLLRVGWLVFRWNQEHDRRFVAAGSALLLVVGIGGLLAALGVGS